MSQAGAPADHQADALETLYREHRAAHSCDLRPPVATALRELEVLVRATRARYVLEVVTGLGHRSLAVAGAFGQTGRLDTVEPDSHHAKLAADHFRRSALADRIRIHTAAPTEVLPALNGPYDFAILDPAAARPGLIGDIHRLLRAGGTLLVEAAGGKAAEQSLAAQSVTADERFLVSIDPGSGRILAVRLG